MYVHRDTGLVFLANPRTGSRATARALLGIGFQLVGDHHSNTGADRERAFAMVIEGLFPVPDGREHERILKPFSTVRDLRTVLESWGRHLKRPELSHGDVLDRMPGNLPMVAGWESWTMFPHAQASDRLLRYENLEADLNELLDEHGLGPVKLERVAERDGVLPVGRRKL